LAVAGIGFNIEHDGGHNAYSNRPWVNRLSALTLDLVGASSYVWRWKHAVMHHSYVNISGHDTDIDLGGLGRLSPDTPYRWYFRWQHLYLWPLYGVMVMKWHFFDDFRDVLTGRVGHGVLPRPTGWSLVSFLGGKLVFLALAFFIPLLFHPLWAVLVCYVLVFALAGLLLAVVFQLAHCVELASFTSAPKAPIEKSWAVHQLQSTVNFAPGNRLASWCLGGLNYQIEHHLFPTICHLNYPALSSIIRRTCREHGLSYNEFPTIRAGIASHYRWLKRMGARPEITA
jgi:linoleoyl-CoA desaturase